MGSRENNQGLAMDLLEDTLGRETILAHIQRAGELRGMPSPPQTLRGMIVGLLFLEPSTRTRVGFHAAAARLGASVIDIGSPKYNDKMERPESLEDTVRSVSAYCDLLVIRHPSSEGMRSAFAASKVPVINAGAGTDSHPSQALIDLNAIYLHRGTLDNLRIGVVGDLKASRCARSLVRALRSFHPTELRLMAPRSRQLPAICLTAFSKARVSLSDGLQPEGLDVLYMAGYPPGPGRETAAGRRMRTKLRLTSHFLQGQCANMLVLCPLPRIDEISSEWDRADTAAYFSQSDEGLSIRMSILEQTLEDVHTNKHTGGI